MDWYTVLKAFKEKNPNGDGKPVYPFTTRYGQTGLLTFMEAYGMTGFEIDEQFYVENNKVKYVYIEPKFKDVLKFLNKLYKEGLIDPQYAANNKAVWLSRLNSGMSGATADWFVYIDTVENTLMKTDPNADFDLILPPKGPNGIQMTTSQQKEVRGVAAISSKSKYKIEIIKFFDYFFSDECNILMNFGVEDEHYKMANGNPVYTDMIAKDPGGKSVLQMLFAVGHREWAFKQDIRYENQITTDKSRKARDSYVKYIKPTIPVLPFTDEERTLINSKYTEIQTYKDEMVDKFIMGLKPLDKFDDFVKKVRSVGIDDVLKTEQKAYDRYNK